MVFPPIDAVANPPIFGITSFIGTSCSASAKIDRLRIGDGADTTSSDDFPARSVADKLASMFIPTILPPWRQYSTLRLYSFRCGFCSNKVASNSGGQTEEQNKPPAADIRICPLCGGPTFFHDGKQVPSPLPSNDVASLPDDVQALYTEARQCFTVNAYTASVLSLRKLVRSRNSCGFPVVVSATSCSFRESNSLVIRSCDVGQHSLPVHRVSSRELGAPTGQRTFVSSDPTAKNSPAKTAMRERVRVY